MMLSPVVGIRQASIQVLAAQKIDKSVLGYLITFGFNRNIKKLLTPFGSFVVQTARSNFHGWDFSKSQKWKPDGLEIGRAHV